MSYSSDDRQPQYNDRRANSNPNYSNHNNDYQSRNNRSFNPNKFNHNKTFNQNVINELRDKNIKVTWKNKEESDWELFKVLNTFYAYGEGWMKLIVIESDKKNEFPQELLNNPIFIRINDIKYFMVIQEK